MPTLHSFCFKKIKRIILTLSALLIISTSFAQIAGAGKGNNGNGNGNGNNGNGNGNGNNGNGNNGNGHGNGGNSNDHVPNGNAYGHNKGHDTRTMLTPTGWGNTESYAFLTASGTPKQLYGSKADLGVRAGAGIGDYRKLVSLVAMVNVYDASSLANLKLRDVTYSFFASRSLGKNASVTVGSLNMFADTAIADGVHSLFAAYSWSVNGLTQVTPGNPRLSFTVGAGNGKFYLKSPADMKSGRGQYGTGIFANVSYDVVKNFSVNAEWTGLNLGLTTAYRLPNDFATIFLGVSDLTRYTGDSPIYVFGVGRAFGFKK